MGWLIEEWIRHRKTWAWWHCHRPQFPWTTPPPRAVVQVHVIQERKKKMGAIYTCVRFLSTPLRKPDRNTGMGETGEKRLKKHTQRGTKFPRWRWFWRAVLVGAARHRRGLVFVIVLVVFVLVVVVPHVWHGSLHARPAVVRVIRAGGHGAIGATVTTRGKGWFK